MNLSPEQERAVNSDHPAIVMVAGPGSGKTRTLIERTKSLISCELLAGGTTAGHMVAITFTNEAANELKKRSELDFNYCGTLHGYMLKLLQQYGERIGIRESLSVISEDLRDELLVEISARTGYKGTKKDLQAALDLGLFRLDEIRQNSTMSKAETTALAYYQAMRAGSMVDYDSILQFGLAVIKKIDCWDLKVHYLFVDEYQDSSPIDAEIYEALPITNKFFIGDPDQSIYNFRGADVENIICLTRSDDVETLTLEDNYRSDSAIANAAQRLIEHNENRPAKVTKSITGSHGVLLINEFDHEEEEIRWMARRINELEKPDNVAVLLRSNKLVERYKDRLAGYGVQIPFEKHNHLPIDWKRAQLYLSLMCDPENDRLAYAWLKETRGKDEADTARIEAMGINEPICDYVRLPCVNRVETADVLQHLTKASFSEETKDHVRAGIDLLSEGDTLPQLVSMLMYDPPRQRQNGVTVCTYHAAKGREWDYVFLPAFEQGIIPSLSKNASIEEERRVAFVGMTRARHSLTITHAKVRAEQYKRGEYVTTPSQFIAEMGL